MLHPARRLLTFLLALAGPAGVVAACDLPVSACERSQPGAVALIAGGRAFGVSIDPGEDAGVRRAATDLGADLANVAGAPAPSGAAVRVIAGTLGRGGAIDTLARTGRIDISGLAGRWEGYVQQVVERPVPGVDRALVIAGADRRGTIFGLYDVSAKIGVSPWTYWADVPPQRHATLFLTPGRIAEHPRVRYRGIFLNDEEPALGGWARATHGGLNRQFYERVFQLLLRSKANFLWPAMWGKSLWDDDPTTAPLAREMGVILGTSHHEPMGRAHVEWERHGAGPWDYRRNETALRRFWREGLARRDAAEDVVTVGMRGDGDEPMTQGTAVPLLERIVADQRRIIAETTGRPAAETPQVWALYKEVQDYHDQGMRVPDDVTLLFSDDNWGNIRRLPDPAAPARAGGYGLYYHFDYVGAPRNYKWLDTTNIARVWQQMALAHARGADRLWIVNVGDLKPMEFATSFFLAMAWNPAAMTPEALGAYPARWAAQQFGEPRAEAIGAVLARYGQLASRRKPELIDANSYTAAQWPGVIAGWDRLETRAHALARSVAPERRDAFHGLVLHRIEAMANLHRLYEAAALGREAEVRAHFAEDAAIRRRYEAIAGGKWAGMMSQTHIGYSGWQEPPADVMPALSAPRPAPSKAPRRTLPASSGRQVAGDGRGWLAVPWLGADGTGDAMIAWPMRAGAAAPGTGPALDFPVRLARTGALEVRVTAAPGLDVDGRGQQRYAISLDGGAPVTVNLLADRSEAAWEAAVRDNRRVGTTRFPFVPAGTHRMTLWLVDPEPVLQQIELSGAGIIAGQH